MDTGSYYQGWTYGGLNVDFRWSYGGLNLDLNVRYCQIPGRTW